LVSAEPPADDPTAMTAAWPEGVETYDVPSASHSNGDIDYELAPPVGGDHSQVWQNCGIYSQPVPDETAVHSLEHGAVWLTYAPDLPSEQIDQLRALVGARTHVLLSPHTEQEDPVVATAWSVQLRLQDAGDPRIERFLREYVQGPQTPEPGAPCSGGVGSG